MAKKISSKAKVRKDLREFNKKYENYLLHALRISIYDKKLGKGIRKNIEKLSKVLDKFNKTVLSEIR